mmetsp:Transcript_59444/g.126380  ORF Transcript_59444/g.126380 Transcript_59444/m.126380 type:complete len:208 (-) Transcript_59444:1206-1829(-)
MRHELQGILVIAAEERYEAARYEEEAHTRQSPPHGHPVLVHGREDEDGEPPHNLPEEGDQSHDLRLLSLGDEGHGEGALAGKHPPEGDPHERGIEVDEVLVALGGTSHRPSDEGVDDREHHLGAAEGVEGVDPSAHSLGDHSPGDVGEEHGDGSDGDLLDVHVHEEGEEGDGDGQNHAGAGLGGEEERDHEPLKGLVFTENDARGHE